MRGVTSRLEAGNWQRGQHRSSKAMIGCEVLEGRQLLSRGMGLDALASGGFGRHSMSAELGSFGGGGSGAMFGKGNLGLGGGVKNPIFLLTSSLLNSGNGSTTPPSRSVLSSSAVQSAFQTLQTDFKNDVSVGAQPTHASVGQLQDDLTSIRKGTLTGTAASTAIQNDESAILTSLGLTTTQVSQIQSDLQAVQSAINSPTTTTTTSTPTTSTASPNSPTTTVTAAGTSAAPMQLSTASGMAATPMAVTTAGVSPAPSSAVQTAFQTLQTDLKTDTPSGAQPKYAAIGQVEDDLVAISNGTLTGSQAATTVQTDAAAVLSSMGLTSTQITQIQSDQAAVTTAMQASSSSTSTTQTSSSPTSTTSSASSSPTSIASVEATMQSVQSYLVGLPGLEGPGMMRFGGSGMSGSGPVVVGSSVTSGSAPDAGGSGSNGSGPEMSGGQGFGMGRGGFGPSGGGWR